MFHEPYGIQQEGRVFKITEEAKIQPTKSCKGSRRKVGKNQSWKYRSTCQNCGTEFAGRKGASNRFCRSECQHEFSVKRWLPCSKCLAAVGYGSKKAGRILGVSPSNITRQWNKHGIVAQKPQLGSWKAAVGLTHAERRLSDQERMSRMALKAYERHCMAEIKAAASGFDWSYLWIKEKARIAMKKRYLAMSDAEKKEWNRKSSARNPARRKASLKRWKKEKRKIDPIYRMIESFRSRLSLMARGKDSKTKELVGCSLLQLRKHLELKFKRGMSWDNYGTYWHVDHIIPCSLFDHNDPKQVRQCWHWTNLQPLEAKKNIAKSNKITDPQMHLALCSIH